MAFKAAYKPKSTIPALVLMSLMAAMISTLFAGSKCMSLPGNASEIEIKTEIMTLLAERGWEQVKIGGHSRLQNDQLDQRIVRSSGRYTTGNEVRVFRSNTEIQVCVEQAQRSQE